MKEPLKKYMARGRFDSAPSSRQAIEEYKKEVEGDNKPAWLSEAEAHWTIAYLLFTCANSQFDTFREIFAHNGFILDARLKVVLKDLNQAQKVQEKAFGKYEEEMRRMFVKCEREATGSEFAKMYECVFAVVESMLLTHQKGENWNWEYRYYYESMRAKMLELRYNELVDKYNSMIGGEEGER